MLLASLGMAVLPPGAEAQDDQLAVLAPVGRNPGPEQDPATVARQIGRLATAKAMGKQASTYVVDAQSGTVLYDDEGDVGRIPASTNKITTAMAVLRHAGLDRTVRTRTTMTGGHTVYLIGGGDPLLVSRPPELVSGRSPYPRFTPLRKLVGDTAAKLRGDDVTSVAVKVDSSFFTGPDWGEGWPRYYLTTGITAPVSALLVDDGRVDGDGAFAPDPAIAAGDTFAKLLRREGIKVTSVRHGTSPASAEELATISSAPIYELVEEALTWSDNETAESLFRLAGHFAGHDASFAGGAKAVAEALESLRISTVMTSFNDGSGLSHDDRIPPSVLAAVISNAVRGEDDLWPITSGLAVAGVSGTLQHRFSTAETDDAAGWLRGKTGTLNFTSTLAGFVQSRSGRILAFAALGNDAKNTSATVTMLDRIGAQLADCGCPGENRDSGN